LRTSTLPAKQPFGSEDFNIPVEATRVGLDQIDVALLTGGSDRHYTFGLATALIAKGMRVDVIGSDAVDGPEMHATPDLEFLNLRGDQRPDATLPRKILRLLLYYARLGAYTWTSKVRIFHILWNNKFQFFDRTLMILYYKLRGKKVVLTAHNVNEARREQRDSLFNRFTLRIQYRLSDHIFVHTEKMKDELLKDYGVNGQAVTVIPFGINNAVPCTDLTPAEARRRLGIGDGERVILFFGNLRPSKGLEYLLAAFQQISSSDSRYRLIIAGQRTKEFGRHWNRIRPTLEHLCAQGLVILRDEFIPDEDTESYFKAADVLALPYTEIFQSGVLFLGYSFGLPAIATDVGSFREDVIEGATGFLCRPHDPIGLARTIEKYFHSDLYGDLASRKEEIRKYVGARHSWSLVAGITRNVYEQLSI
jgi:glycosyltransferase involved in cell wall biosynthesis